MVKSPSYLRKGLSLGALGNLFFLVPLAVSVTMFMREDMGLMNTFVPLELGITFLFIFPAIRRVRKGRDEFGPEVAADVDRGLLSHKFLWVTSVLLALSMFVLRSWLPAYTDGTMEAFTFEFVMVGAMSLLFLSMFFYSQMLYYPVTGLIKERYGKLLRSSVTLFLVGIMGGNSIIVLHYLDKTGLFRGYHLELMIGFFIFQALASTVLFILYLIAGGRARTPGEQSFVKVECPICKNRFTVLDGMRISRCPECATRGFVEKKHGKTRVKSTKARSPSKSGSSNRKKAPSRPTPSAARSKQGTPNRARATARARPSDGSRPGATARPAGSGTPQRSRATARPSERPRAKATARPRSR